MPSLTVMRHSLAVANEQGILMGAKLNSPLSEKGIDVAKTKSASLKAEGFKPDKVFTSKLTRAKQTAVVVLKELGIDVEIIELEALNERDFGDYDGKPYKFVLDAFNKHGDNPPSIEPVDAFIKRVIGAWDQIKKETTGATLVITHSNPVIVMQAAINNPESISRFWEIGDPGYCEGFVYDISLSN
jgi:broad specificity phosphatase PhoE